MVQFRSDMLQDLTQREQSDLRERGYLLYKSEAVAAFRANLVDELHDISLRLLRRIGVDTAPLEGLSYRELMAWCVNEEKDQRYTRLFYEMYPSMANVIGLINHSLPFFLARSAGIRSPVPGTLPTVRIDRPGVTRFLTKPHQDYWYSLISERSVVLWMPIIALSADMGLLGVVPGSHKRGYQPFDKHEGEYTFTMRNDYPDADYVECDVATDEILIFDQFLVHRSGANVAKVPRVTMQLRYNDLESMDEVAPTFTAVTSDFVLKRQVELLSGAWQAPPLKARA
jgi:Phytanoyl-CoA dioxygenase (PhyH)